MRRDVMLVYRYKDDPYDRIWEPYWDDRWTQLSSGLSNDGLNLNSFKPPAVVMETAATPKNATDSLDFQWEDDYTDNNETQHQYYFYLYFAELRKLGANQTSSFNITLNDSPWARMELVYGITYTRCNLNPWFGHKNYHISLFRTESSSLPPIINALEIYLVKDFSSQLETQKDDGILLLNLSSSGLTGHIAADISKLTMLKSLDLSDNELSGTIPSFLAQLQSLEYLNLANNNLTGSVSNELLQKQSDGLLSLSVGQNPNLCASTSCISQSNDTRKKENNAVIAVVTSIAGILLLLVIIAAVIIFRQRKQYAAARNSILGKPRSSIKGSELESKQRQYSFNEVVKMTNNFDRILGRGGFGTVYHGFIEDIQVAVKMLSLSSVHGYQQFVAEARKNNRGTSLNWEDRLQIALDAAQGLEYLHNGCKPPIIHIDVKCTNILLNENFHAKLADFGLSKCFVTDGDTHVSTIVAGTPGYLDP
ncbi:hypothetical protein S245_028758, partial [Arachis hypogaea]